MRTQLVNMRQRNKYLEAQLKRIERDENLLKQKVDLDDKLALKKLVVMLKAKNDHLERQVGTANIQKYNFSTHKTLSIIIILQIKFRNKI